MSSFSESRFNNLKGNIFSTEEVAGALFLQPSAIKNWLREQYIRPELGRAGTGKSQRFTLDDAYHIAILGQLATSYIQLKAIHCYSQIVRRFFRTDYHTEEKQLENRAKDQFLIISKELVTTLSPDPIMTARVSRELEIRPKGRESLMIAIPLQKVLNELDEELWKKVQERQNSV